MRLPRASHCAAVVACGLALMGCAAVSKPDLARALRVIDAQRDQALTCTRDDRCAAESPLLGAAQQQSNRVALLEDGNDALAVRVHLIRAARRSIDIQTYIFSDDDAGRLIIVELVEAARRGVKVRVLSDQLFTLDNIRMLADLARVHRNFEFKVYNPTFRQARTEAHEFVAGVLCCFYRFNQRMHNKLWIVDGRAGITGGRNIENTYFGWGDEFNFIDRDALVLGPVGAEMQRSFDVFWNHAAAVGVAELHDVAARVLAEADGTAAPVAIERLRYTDGERVGLLAARAQDPAWIKAAFLGNSMQVRAASYYSDTPAKHARGRRRDPDRVGQGISARIVALLRAARREVLLQTPYLLISDRAEDVFLELRNREPRVRVIASTNSLASTDSFVVYAVSYKHRRKYLRRLGFEIHEYKPEAGLRIEDYQPYLPDLGINWRAVRDFGARAQSLPVGLESVRRTLHAKSLVIDETVALIGTHNFDPRSADLNTESGLIIDDEVFAARVANAIRAAIAPENSWVVARREPAPVIGEVNAVAGEVSAALPLFDLWPFRYATNFELKPGCAPISPQAPGFHECHTAVGDFPAVEVPLRTLYTRFVVAFGVGLTPIL